MQTSARKPQPGDHRVGRQIHMAVGVHLLGMSLRVRRTRMILGGRHLHGMYLLALPIPLRMEIRRPHGIARPGHQILIAAADGQHQVTAVVAVAAVAADWEELHLHVRGEALLPREPPTLGDRVQNLQMNIGYVINALTGSRADFSSFLEPTFR
jgi:hypothetical protein